MRVAVWDLNADEFGGVFAGAVDFAVLVVDVAGDVLGETMSRFAEAVAAAVDFQGVVALGAVAGVGFEVVEGPGFGGCQRSAELIVFLGCKADTLCGGRWGRGAGDVGLDLDDHRPQ